MASFFYLDLSIRGRSYVFFVILLVKVEQDTPLKASSFAFVIYYDCYNLKRARGDHHPLVMHMLMLNIMSAIPSFHQTVEYHSRTPCKHDTSGLKRLSTRDIVQHPDKCQYHDPPQLILNLISESNAKISITPFAGAHTLQPGVP